MSEGDSNDDTNEQYSEFMFEDEDENENGTEDGVSFLSKTLQQKLISHSIKKNGVTYEMTISPPPFLLKYQKMKGERPTIEKMFESHFMDSVNQFIGNLKDYVNSYEFYPELGHNSLLHFHGKVNFRNYVDWLAFMAPNYCQYQINEYRPLYWDKYIKKDENIISEFLSRNFKIKYGIKYGIKKE